MDFHKLPNLDLRLLAIFDEIVKHRNLTLAADSLGITQSAISKSLQRLRHELGDALFVRTQNGMEPTPRAIELVAPIAEMLRTYRDRIAIAPHFDPANSDRMFTIHASDLGISALVPVLARHLKTTAPHARMNVVLGGQREVVDGLANGEIDLSIGAFPNLHESGIYQQRLFTEKYICLVRSDHPLCGVGTIDIERFLQQTHIVISAGKSGHAHARAEAMLLHEIPPLKVAIKVPSFVLGAMLLRNTDHVLTIPSIAANTLATEFDLVSLPFALDLPGFVVAQYWHERFRHDPASQWLRAQVHLLFGQS
ncbi:LysR family transcriptional regulator [Trinickia mobilis]|uniref:LysR family transcriptional regulator n=1 Tax=Trinickia mobilis TaxID=2816356 RepID=UPI001A8ED409|nr:LysR family transcriptional regulator [Trinickia mobilis]